LASSSGSRAGPTIPRRTAAAGDTTPLHRGSAAPPVRSVLEIAYECTSRLTGELSPLRPYDACLSRASGRRESVRDDVASNGEQGYRRPSSSASGWLGSVTGFVASARISVRNIFTARSAAPLAALRDLRGSRSPCNYVRLTSARGVMAAASGAGLRALGRLYKDTGALSSTDQRTGSPRPRRIVKSAVICAGPGTVSEPWWRQRWRCSNGQRDLP